ncbi:MAG: Ig-like domain-containing protein, partial [Roseiflexaceae bacterium]|nr:Ig-like domain-containing protein [Roseiflexaceae bacterium]
ATTPADGAAQVERATPLTLRLSQPFALEVVRAGLQISPTIKGEWSAQTLPDATQLITFTPAAAWQPETTYRAALAADLLPLDGNLTLQSVPWSFRTAPRLAVVGRFPGEGQTLPIGQELRLIFSTPIDADMLAGALDISPPVGTPRIRASGNEAQITADFQPASVYTLTLQLDPAEPQPYLLRFRTAPPAAELALAGMEDHVLRLRPGQAGPLLRRNGLTSLQASLYPLDEATAVRLLAFGGAEWLAFSPERSGLVPLRTWSQIYSDTGGMPVEAPLALLDGATPLPTGVFYLRLRSPERLRADALVFVSETSLTLRRVGQDALIWATDGTGTPRNLAALALYQSGTLVGRGQSGGDGIWRLAAGGADRAPLTALSADGALAIERATAPALPRFQMALFAARSRFQPGELVDIGGFAQTVDGTPAAGARALLTLQRDDGTRVVTQPVFISSTGLVSASVRLPTTLPAGEYQLNLALGGSSTDAVLTVADAMTPALALDVAPGLFAGQPLTFTLALLPAASMPISWTLRALPEPLLDGFSIGDTPAATISGGGATDSAGMFSATISDTLVASAPLRYQLVVRANDGADTALARAELRVQTASELVGLRLASRIGTAGEPLEAAALVLDSQGQPVEGREVLFELLRLPESGSLASATRVVLRSVRSGTDGRAALPLLVRTGGAYLLRASVADAERRRSFATAPLWVAAANTTWPAGTPQLLADQPRYRPGEAARLLSDLAAPTSALLLVGQAAEVRAMQPGLPLTITIPADAAPLLPVELMLPAADGQHRVVATTLAVEQRGIPLNLSSDGISYAPGATATITISTTVVPGSAPAVMVALADEQAPGTAVFLRDLRADTSGQLSVGLRLPDTTGVYTLHAWAADQRGFGAAQATLTVTEPLVLDLIAPAMLRAGDTFELVALLRNTSPLAQRVQLALVREGLTLTADRERAAVQLAVGETRRLVWQAQVGPGQVGQPARVRLTATAGGAQPQQIARDWTILPGTVRAPTGALIERSWSAEVMPQQGGPLALAAAPSVAALIEDFIATLGTQAQRSPADSAALLLFSAPVSETRELAEQALAELLAAQQGDGGWQLYSGEGSNPDLTLLTLEALVEARRAGFVVAPTQLNRAIERLTRSEQGGVLRLYAESLLGQPNQAALASLSNTAGSRDSASLALLLLASQPGSATAQALAAALTERVVGEGDQARVADAEQGDVVVTALVARALASQPTPPQQLAGLLRTLAAARGPGGWQNSLIGARSLAALQAGLGERSAGSYTIWLDGEQLTEAQPGDADLAVIRRLAVPAERLRATSMLTATVSGGPLLIAYELEAVGLRDLLGVRLLREYLDPATGQPIDLAALRVGASVDVRLTLLAPQGARMVEVIDRLPGGATLVDAGESVLPARLADGQLLFGYSLLEAGVSQLRYTLRLDAAGSFAVPAPSAVLSDGTRIAAGQAVRFGVMP